MTKDRTRNARSGSPEPERGRIGPSESHIKASQAFAQTFERIRDEGDELLRLERTARRIFAASSPSEFEGLSRLLDIILPHGVQQRRIARALALDCAVLERLRASTIDPFDIDPRPLTALARTVELDYATFWLLAQRDHQRLALQARARSVTSSDDVEAAFRSAWERDSLNDASSM